MQLRAFAKINLDLRVLGKRDDGYHELRTTFQSVALHDTLTFRTVPGPFVIDCTDPSCPVDASNLVWRAADLLWRAARRRRTLARVRVELPESGPTYTADDCTVTITEHVPTGESDGFSRTFQTAGDGTCGAGGTIEISPFAFRFPAHW